MQRFVERRVDDHQIATAPLLDPFDDRVAVHRVQRQALEHEDVQRSVQQIARFPRHDPSTNQVSVRSIIRGGRCQFVV